MERIIEEFGGTVCTELEHTVDYAIVADGIQAATDTELRDAVTVVSEKWLTDSIASGSVQSAVDYLHTQLSQVSQSILSDRKYTAKVTNLRGLI